MQFSPMKSMAELTSLEIKSRSSIPSSNAPLSAEGMTSCDEEHFSGITSDETEHFLFERKEQFHNRQFLSTYHRHYGLAVDSIMKVMRLEEKKFSEFSSPHRKVWIANFHWTGRKNSTKVIVFDI